MGDEIDEGNAEGGDDDVERPDAMYQSDMGHRLDDAVVDRQHILGEGVAERVGLEGIGGVFGIINGGDKPGGGITTEIIVTHGATDDVKKAEGIAGLDARTIDAHIDDEHQAKEHDAQAYVTIAMGHG